MDILQALPKSRRVNRMLATVEVTLLAGVITAFVLLHHRPTQAGETRQVPAPGGGLATAAVHVDASLPTPAESFAKSPAKDEEPSPSF